MRVAAVIGSPVQHSLSPALHNAAFRHAGLDWVYVAFEVAPGSAAAALAAMRTLGLGGLSVTTPHKEDVAAAVDVLAPAAAALRSVNTVVWSGGRLVGHSTDGDGFVASLAASGVELDGASVALVGAGAAARSVVDALGRAGAADIAIVNRTVERAAESAALAPAARVGSPADITGADIVVNATSVGMGTSDVPFDPALLRAGPGRRRPRLPPAADGAAGGRRSPGLLDRRRPRDARPPSRPPAAAVDRHRRPTRPRCAPRPSPSSPAAPDPSVSGDRGSAAGTPGRTHSVSCKHSDRGAGRFGTGQ